MSNTSTIPAAPPQRGMVRLMEQHYGTLAVTTADYQPTAWGAGVVEFTTDFGDDNPARVVVTVKDLEDLLAAIAAHNAQVAARDLVRSPGVVAPHELLEPVSDEVAE